MALLERDVLDLLVRVAALEAYVTYPTTGTWTPTFVGSTTAGVFTYTTQSGVYTRGPASLVYIAARIVISAIGTPPAGDMRIGGLPFTCEAGYYHAVNFGFISNINYTAAALQLTGLVDVGNTYISLYESFDNSGALSYPAVNFTNVAADLIFSAVYRV